MKIKCWKLNLQLFNEPNPNPNPNPAPVQPFMAFADENAYKAHLDGEAAKRQADFLKTLGVEDPEALKGILQAHADNQNKNKTELEKAQGDLQKLTGERDTAAQQAVGAILRSEGILQALKLGVNAERIEDVLTLANISAIEVKDGKVDGDALKKSIEAVLQRIPELAGGGFPAAGGSNFGGGNNKGKSNPWKSDCFNLTEQGKIMRENPALAKQLMAEAQNQ